MQPDIPSIYMSIQYMSYMQCCGAGAGAARSRTFLLEPEPKNYAIFGSDSGSGSSK